VRHLARQCDELRAYDADVLIVGIGTLDQARALVQRLDLPFAIAADPDGSAYQAYGLDGLPVLRQRAAPVYIQRPRMIRHENR
jgi:peroxiredoxin